MTLTEKDIRGKYQAEGKLTVSPPASASSSQEITVDTNEVAMAAVKIDEINQSIDARWQELNRLIDVMDKYWDGDANRATVQKFFDIRNTYRNSFHDVFKQYSVFLRKLVGIEYEETETVNTKIGHSLTDGFK